MKKKWLGITVIIQVFLTGCAGGLLMEGLSGSELLVIGSRTALLSRSGAALRGTTLAVSNEARFFSQLRRVRIEPPAAGRTARLYVTENKTKQYFGVLENKHTIRISDLENRLITMPYGGSLYRVKGSKVNVRVGPGEHYNVYKLNETALQYFENDVVLVLRPVDNWYEIKFDDISPVGYIFAPLLMELSEDENRQYNQGSLDCDVCDKQGYVFKKLNCYACNGTGKKKCEDCSGNGKFVCPDCLGKTKFVCSECHGETKFLCSDCGGKGNLKCTTCNGKGLVLSSSGISTCYTCAGRRRVACWKCSQTGYLQCWKCSQTGYLQCWKCSQTGYLQCWKCSQTGQLYCSACSGKGLTEEKYQCSKCDGTGFISNDIAFDKKKSGNTSEKQLIFSDYFNDNRHDWPIIEFDEFNFKLQNGKYSITNESSKSHLATVQTTVNITKDYDISVSLQHVSGVVNYGYGIMFSVDRNNYYAFLIANEHYQLYKYWNGSLEQIFPWTSCDVIKKSGAESNRLKIKKQGNTCWLYINDIYVNKFFNYADFGNWIGFLVENNQIIEFDNLEIHQSSE